MIAKLFAAAGVSVKIVPRTPLATTIVSLVAAGFGIAVVPRSFRQIAMDGVAIRQLACDAEVETFIVQRVKEVRPVPAAFLHSCQDTLRQLQNADLGPHGNQANAPTSL